MKTNNTKFKSAWRDFFLRYNDFNGVSTFSEFWITALPIIVVTSALTFIFPFIAIILNVFLFIPFLSLNVRRYRDAGARTVWAYIWCISIFLGAKNVIECLGSGPGELLRDSGQCVFIPYAGVTGLLIAIPFFVLMIHRIITLFSGSKYNNKKNKK